MIFILSFLRQFLLVDAAGEDPAIHCDDLPGSEACFATGEIHSRGNQFLRMSKATHRRTHEQLLSSGAVDDATVERGRKYARRDGIHRNAEARPLYREGARHGCYRGFARAVRGDLLKRNEARQRCDVDDASEAPLHHHFTEYLAAAQRAGQVYLEDAMPGLFIEFQGRHALRHPCRVDENVDYAKLRQHGFPQSQERSST